MAALAASFSAFLRSFSISFSLRVIRVLSGATSPCSSAFCLSAIESSAEPDGALSLRARPCEAVVSLPKAASMSSGEASISVCSSASEICDAPITVNRSSESIDATGSQISSRTKHSGSSSEVAE